MPGLPFSLSVCLSIQSHWEFLYLPVFVSIILLEHRASFSNIKHLKRHLECAFCWSCLSFLSPTWEIRDWSKSIGGGGPEQRRGGSWDFEPCARGGSSNFQLLLEGGSPYFLRTTNETVDYTCYIKHSQLELLLKYSQTCCARKYKGWQAAHLYGRGTLW